ncbi:TIM barrel protein [Calidifontibacter indicus]|uniref:2-keto-myo-inositol dehydratase n=1 Tax=Calidifontibacter indicus TaxID=419650 RepID=A0A3D9UJB7_9MICO|nr:TIM barrel protein [Calidifontibacter indicus]REF29538.1 2-keto-myo-inositol dehydratase [Calidifontibacter indicus]
MSALASRIAGAPISWGVCEVPGWGYQLPADVVLEQMRELGLSATEFGPDGFLPDDPQEKVDVLTDYDLRAVGQFVPVVLHDAEFDPLPDVIRAIEALTVAQASTVVIAAATGLTGYDTRPQLADEQWVTLLRNLDRIDVAATESGLRATLHPHVGTMVESGADALRVIEGSTIALCLDTGHLLIGGGDPGAVVQQHADRIGHVHLKDVRLDLARRVQHGELTYAEAVGQGMYVPLGTGDVPVELIVRGLEDAGYRGWYVLEQDTMLADAPGGTAHSPLDDVSNSVAYLMSVGTR